MWAINTSATDLDLARARGFHEISIPYQEMEVSGMTSVSAILASRPKGKVLDIKIDARCLRVPGDPDQQTLQPGTRVQVRGEPIGVTLRNFTGEIVRPDKWEGYYIIRLDAPAIYHHADGSVQDLWEIREDAENLRVIPEE